MEKPDAGELHDQLQRKGKLSIEEARFYAAEIVEILEYLRDQKVRCDDATIGIQAAVASKPHTML